MSEEVKKWGRGGFRPGAGVKKGHKVRYKKIRNGCVPYSNDPNMLRTLCTCRLPLYIVMWLEKQPKSCGKVIEEAILKTFDVQQKLDAAKWNVHEWKKDEVQSLVSECESNL